MTIQDNDQSLVGYSLGKYEIHAEIGRGGMGMVYKGYDPLLDRYLAVKVLAPHLVWETEFVQRFLREARAAARLKHPNIVTIHDVGQQEGWYYFVMEYVEGIALDKFIKQHGALPVHDVLDIVKVLALALDYAHASGLIHRDIKPANIIMGMDGHIMLTDFGIARAVDEKRMTSTGTILGTPEYMAPEQVSGQQADARSDLYSLAVVTYQMLSGDVPYKADNTLALLYKVVNEPLPSIRKLHPALPVAVEPVLQKALAKDPAARYPNCAAFYEALCDVFGRLPESVPSFLPNGRLVAEKRRAPARIENAVSPPLTPQPAMPPSAAPELSPTVMMADAVAKTAPRRRVPIWAWGIAGVIALLGVVIGSGMAANLFNAASTPDVAHVLPVVDGPTLTPEPVGTVPPTNTPFHTPIPTFTPTSTPTPARTPTRTPRVTRTPTQTATPRVTETPDATPTPRVTATFEPTTVMPSPTAGDTQPTVTPRATSPGAIITFEQMGTWRRGDQPYGELSQTQEQVYGGSYAAKLSYDFPVVDDDFVVFSQPRNLAGAPNRFSAWVYGDGSGHFLNLWIQDAQNQVWSVHLGRVGAAGWKQMSGTLAPGLPWPDGHVSGPDNGIVDYPVRFYALVLDRPNQGIRKGNIYIDEIAAWRSDDVTVPTPAGVTPQATTTPAATVAPAPPGEIGRIVFTVQTGETYYLYSTDPNWSQMQEIGQTDRDYSTCAGGGSASTLTGITVNLYGVNKCNITARTDACTSPDGRYKVITHQVDLGVHSLSIHTADDSEQRAYYQGPLNRTVGIQWTPDSQRVIFGVGSIINIIQAGVDGYKQVTAHVDDTWPAQISPDGSMLYYLQAVGSVGALDVFAVNLDGSGLRNLTNAPIAYKLCPRWRR